MSNQIERTIKCIDDVITVMYILFFIYRVIFHIGVPVLFLSVFDKFMMNTTEFFVNETYEELGMERAFYFLILLNSMTIGVLDCFLCAVTNLKNRNFLVSGVTLYSLVISGFYLMFYYDLEKEDNINIYYFQASGFLELLSPIFWFFIMGLNCLRNVNKKKISLYQPETLINAQLIED